MNDNGSDDGINSEVKPIRKGWLWTPVPEGVILSKNLDSNDKVIYAFLLMRSGNNDSVWYGVQSVCNELGMSDSMVRRAFKKLTEENWIRRKRRMSATSLTYVFERQEDCLAYDLQLVHGRTSDSAVVNETLNAPVNSLNRDNIKQRQLNRDILTNTNKSPVIPDATDDAIKAIEEVAIKYPPQANANSRRGTIKAAQNGYAQDFALKEEWEKNIRTTPNWELKGYRDFLAWLKERPQEQTVTAFANWWYETDWRGKQGQPPTIYQAQEFWPQAFIPARRDPRNMGVEVF